MRRHGTRLLMAGGEQEGGRAAIALHADQEQARLGLRELGRAMRPHRAAAMQVGIDQRRQDLRTIERRIEVQAELAEKAQIGPQAGRDHEFVRGNHRSEEHTSELQSLMRISYAVFCLKKKMNKAKPRTHNMLNTTVIII